MTSLSSNQKIRFEFIDYLKGSLIFLVILGHLLPGSIQENIIRYIIYSFHMPLFLAISGYLITTQRIKNYTLKDIFFRYSKRMIIPWFLAFLVFKLGNVILYQTAITWKSLILSFLYPWYHLWFVPALLAMIIFTFYLEKLRVSPYIILSACFTFSFVWLSTSHGNTPYPAPLILGEKRLYFMFFFFYFGYYLRNHPFQISWESKCVLSSLVIFSSLLRILDFFMYFTPQITTLIFLILNTSLIAFSLYFFNQSKLFLQNAIAFLGTNSLPIYLWHILPIWLMRHFKVETQAPILFYSITIFSLILFVIFLRFIPKKGAWNTLLFGTT